MLHACLGKGLVDGQLGGHHGVVGGGEHGLDTGGDQSLSRHLHLSGGGAVLLNVLDAVGITESLGIGNGLGGGILLRSYSRPMVSISGLTAVISFMMASVFSASEVPVMFSSPSKPAAAGR